MKVLVCGSREWTNEKVIRDVLRNYLAADDVTIINGACRGADKISTKVAKELGFKVKEFPADWKKFGRAAGPKRNERMAKQFPEMVLCFHNNLNESKGTKNMIETAKKFNIPFLIISETNE